MQQYQAYVDRISQQETLIENEIQRRHELMMAQESPPMPDESKTPTEVINDEAGLPTVEGQPDDSGDIPNPEGYEATLPGTNAGSGRRPYPVG